MSKDLWDALAGLAETRELSGLSPTLREQLRGSAEDLAGLLAACDRSVQEELLTRFFLKILGNLRELDDAARQAIRRHSDDLQTGKTTSGEGLGVGATPPVQGRIPPSGPIAPEILEWARQHLNEAETVAGLREIRETGGLELGDFIQALEQEATPRE